MCKRLLLISCLVFTLLVVGGAGIRLTLPLHAAGAAQEGLGLSPIAANGDWQAVQATGVLTVGTSASKSALCLLHGGLRDRRI